MSDMSNSFVISCWLLPIETWEIILEYLCYRYLASLSLVCKNIKTLIDKIIKERLEKTNGYPRLEGKSKFTIISSDDYTRKATDMVRELFSANNQFNIKDLFQKCNSLIKIIPENSIFGDVWSNGLFANGKYSESLDYNMNTNSYFMPYILDWERIPLDYWKFPIENKMKIHFKLNLLTRRQELLNNLNYYLFTNKYDMLGKEPKKPKCSRIIYTYCEDNSLRGNNEVAILVLNNTHIISDFEAEEKLIDLEKLNWNSVLFSYYSKCNALNEEMEKLKIKISNNREKNFHSNLGSNVPFNMKILYFTENSFENTIENVLSCVADVVANLPK